MLFLVATPIGNLSDFSYRAIETLRMCAYILCEDTRISARLLEHYQIQTPLKSFHLFSEAQKEDSIITDLKALKQIALISDAGTPAIADPGERLVKRCIEENIPVSVIPGANAIITALAGSGLLTVPFQFLGFFPRSGQERAKALMQLMEYEGTSIVYESPHRIASLVKTISKIDPRRQLVIARELTKKFEEYIRGGASELAETLPSTLKGEIVLLIDRKKEENPYLERDPKEHVQFLIDQYGLTKNEAIKTVASLHQSSKQDLYNQFLND